MVNKLAKEMANQTELDSPKRGGSQMGRKASVTFEEYDAWASQEVALCYSVTVGRKPSKASYYLQDVHV